SYFAVIKLNVIEHRAIQLQNIGPTVIVIVEKLCRHAAQEDGLVPNSGTKSLIIEAAIFIVAIETIQFEIKMGDVDIRPTVAVDIRGIDAHSRLIAAIFASSDPRNERHILKRSI